MKRKIKYSITLLHFVAKLAWWMVALSVVFVFFPFVMDWTNGLLLIIPDQKTAIDLWFFNREIPMGFSSHDLISLFPLWFLCSGLGIVCYHFYKVIKWMKEK